MNSSVSLLNWSIFEKNFNTYEKLAGVPDGDSIGTVDSDVLESSLYIMKACPVMYSGIKQLRLFTIPIRLLIDPYYKTPTTTSTPFHTHPSTARCNFTPHPSLHIPLQLHSSPIPIYPAATSFLTHPYISRCNFIHHPSQYTPLQLKLLPYFRKQLSSCSCPSQMHALTSAQIPLYRRFCVGVHVFIFCHPHF
jgi:hypothetical protein